MSLPPNLIREIAAKICRPKGTVSFEYSSFDAFRVGTHGGMILEIPSGGHYFRLERTQDRRLNFYHSSPATGTRLASIDLKPVPTFQRAYLAFAWSSEEVRLYCGPRDLSVGMLSATGNSSPVSYRVQPDGSVYQFGSEGVQVMDVRVQRGKEVILAPTAREVWGSTLQALEILWSGKSDQGFIFESLQSTTTQSMLVTGMENYAKTRLLEIEMEGVPSDPEALFAAFASKTERESLRLSELKEQAQSAGTTLLCVVAASARINFQNFDDLKKAFRSAYGIKIGEIGLPSETINEIHQLIRYRHRIVHVSPLLTFLNQDNVPPEEPVFANRALADKATAAFGCLVDSLHKATMTLRPLS